MDHGGFPRIGCPQISQVIRSWPAVTWESLETDGDLGYPQFRTLSNHLVWIIGDLTMFNHIFFIYQDILNQFFFWYLCANQIPGQTCQNLNYSHRLGDQNPLTADFFSTSRQGTTRGEPGVLQPAAGRDQLGGAGPNHFQRRCVRRSTVLDRRT